MREARAMLGTSLTEVEERWRAQYSDLRSEVRGETQQLSKLFEEISDQIRRESLRLEQAERSLSDCNRALRQSEEQFQSYARDGAHPPWFAQLEGALASVERRLNDQQ